MIKITIPAKELFDERKEEFVYTNERTLRLEHSLISISKWESKWEKPFLDPRPEAQKRTYEENVDYVRCMCLDSNVPSDVFYSLTPENMKQINAYINKKMSATWFSDYGPKSAGPGNVKVITSEVIYAWMVQYGIPAEYQKWHLNRLLTLIRVLNNLNPGDRPKMSKAELMKRNAALNAARKKQLHTRG